MFALSWKAEYNKLVTVCQREALTSYLWIVHSNSEYGLLLPIQITDSYTLNVINNEPFVLHKVGKGETV